MVEWVLVDETEEKVVNPIVEDEKPFQKVVYMVLENYRVPDAAPVGKIVYCGDIQVRADVDYYVWAKIATVVDDVEVDSKEFMVKRGVVKSYVPQFTMKDQPVKVKVRLYQGK